MLFLSHCCATKEQVEDSQLITKRENYPPPSLSPGTAEITATLIKLTQDNSKTFGLFKIDTIHAYGSSTRPVGVGSELDIEFADNLLKNNENELQQILKKDREYRLLIRYLNTGMNIREKNMWKIINIKNMH
jgi:hypothetical protein